MVRFRNIKGRCIVNIYTVDDAELVIQFKDRLGEERIPGDIVTLTIPDGFMGKVTDYEYRDNLEITTDMGKTTVVFREDPFE